MLIINTADSNKIYIGVGDSRVVIQKNFFARRSQSKKLLPEIINLLKKAKVGVNDLKGIITIIGPGAFTALRVGVTTANTLSYALNIPNVGFRLDEVGSIGNLLAKGRGFIKKKKGFNILEPFYGKEPNITLPRQK